MNSKAGRSNNPDFQKAPPTGVNWLLAIAIDEYEPAIGKLNNCVRDVKAFIEVVTQHYHFEAAHIIPLFNQDATCENIHKTFDSLLDQVTANDNLLVYYSGHGEYHERLSRGYWLPVETQNRGNYIPNSDIVDYLNAIPSKHTLLLCDSCFSGALLIDEPTRNISKRYFEDASRWAITSGSKELVSDGTDHSPFAKALLEKMRQHKGDLTVTELGQYIMEKVAAHELQKPQYAPMRVRGHKGGMFVFFQKQDETRDWEATEQENTIAAYSRFRRSYPNGSHSEAAKQKIKTFEEEGQWQKALRRNKVSEYEEYLDDYPNGVYVTEAHEKIEKLLSSIVWKTPAPLTSSDSTPSAVTTIPAPRLSFEPEMIFVQGGTFKMGSNEYDDEEPIHAVTVPDFYIGKYPMTFAEYDVFCEATKQDKPSDTGWGRDQRPVINVSWEDANAYCECLSEQIGKRYRLSTEAEWEYAAWGGKQSKGFEYTGSNNLDEVGWYNENSDNKTHSVGEKKPNELGIYDMSGNVWEWCSDWCDEKYYKESRNSNNPKGPATGTYRVVRGGSWSNGPYNCRAAGRVRGYPTNRNGSIGFRLVRHLTL